MKFISGSVTGKYFEDKIDKWIDDAKLAYRRDLTLDGTKRRKINKNSDREVFLGNKSIFIELKTIDCKNVLTYALWNDGKKHNIKFVQICTCDWFIFEFRPHKPIAIEKSDFLNWAARQKKNSINYKDALSIGFEIEDMKWIKEVVE